MVRRLMDQNRKLMLTCTDERDRHNRDWDVPYPVQTPLRAVNAEIDGAANHDRQKKPRAQEIAPVGDVVALPDLLQLLLELRAGERRRCGGSDGGGHDLIIVGV